MSAPKLSDAQQSFMRAVDGKNWMRPREKDGTLMPRATEARTVQALERLGLIKWVRVGEDGYKYNGVIRAVAKEPGHG